MAETKRRFFLQKKLEREVQEKKEALCVQEFNKRSARVVERLRELGKVRNRFIKQFVPETGSYRHKTAMSDYVTNEEALTAYNVNFERHF